MTKIDLITGFLGSGKTTLLKRYADYLIKSGEKIAILEFDYGPINVDMMLLQQFNNQCDLEMVSGGCDYECFVRRFKTKLIAMGMKHYDRIIIEPSGLFDPVLLFDALNESPLDEWYEVGSIIVVVDPYNFDLSNESEKLFISQISYAGLVYVSKCQLLSKEELSLVSTRINDLCSKYNLSLKKDKIMYKNLNDFTFADFSLLKNVSYLLPNIQIVNNMNGNNYDNIYLLDKKITLSKIKEISRSLFLSDSFGHVIRIKGFLLENNKWYEINLTASSFEEQEIPNGQDVIIIIGEKLDKNKIISLF